MECVRPVSRETAHPFPSSPAPARHELPPSTTYERTGVLGFVLFSPGDEMYISTRQSSPCCCWRVIVNSIRRSPTEPLYSTPETLGPISSDVQDEGPLLSFLSSLSPPRRLFSRMA